MGKVPIIECRKEAGSQPDPNPFWEISRNLANLGRGDDYKKGIFHAIGSAELVRHAICSLGVKSGGMHVCAYRISDEVFREISNARLRV